MVELCREKHLLNFHLNCFNLSDKVIDSNKLHVWAGNRVSEIFLKKQLIFFFLLTLPFDGWLLVWVKFQFTVFLSAKFDIPSSRKGEEEQEFLECQLLLLCVVAGCEI